MRPWPKLSASLGQLGQGELTAAARVQKVSPCCVPNFVTAALKASASQHHWAKLPSSDKVASWNDKSVAAVQVVGTKDRPRIDQGPEITWNNWWLASAMTNHDQILPPHIYHCDVLWRTVTIPAITFSRRQSTIKAMVVGHATMLQHEKEFIQLNSNVLSKLHFQPPLASGNSFILNFTCHHDLKHFLAAS